MAASLDYNTTCKVFPEIALIGSPALRSDIAEIWCEIAAEMPWDQLDEVPQSIKTPRPLIEHIRGVTRIALSIANTAAASLDRAFDRDLLLAACLLHDASKPVETEPVSADDCGISPRNARESQLGMQLQHAVYAAHKVIAKRMPLELANLIVSHTHASNIRSRSWEAAVLFYADYAATDAALSKLDKELYLQRWRL